MKKAINTRATGKLISDLPDTRSPQDSDVFEGQNLNSGSYKITFLDLSQAASRKFNVPVATSATVGGIKSSSSDKNINVLADGTAAVNNVPSILEMNAGLSNKVDIVPGKQLSQEDFTDQLKKKLDGIEDGAQVNVISAISLNGQDVQPVQGKVDLVFTGGGNYVLPVASDAVLGGVKAGANNGELEVSADGVASVRGFDEVSSKANSIGDLSLLSTTNKSSIVSAINEVNLKPGQGVSDYTLLRNKPQINSVTLDGNLTFDDLGLIPLTESEIDDMFK